MKRRGTAAVLVGLVCALAASAGPQALAEGGAKSRVKIKALSASGINGVVTSGKAACEGKRKVSVFRLEDFVSNKIGITKSSSSGKWKLTKQLKEGVYFAKIDATKGCRYAVSRNKRLGP